MYKGTYNRLILIGNGFDIAHNLKTSYNHFFEAIKESTATPSSPSKGIEIGFRGEHVDGTSYEYSIKYKVNNTTKKFPWLKVFIDNIDGKSKFILNQDLAKDSIFFKTLLNKKNSTGNWSDLESLYFELIKSYQDSLTSIKIINKEFEDLKQLLKDYLITEVEDKPSPKLHTGIDRIIMNSREFRTTTFITFNYTSSLLDIYYNNLNDSILEESKKNSESNTPPIHIHGNLKEIPIIFGYGDENSSDYENLQDKLIDDLLINFKTFQYLRTNNYDKILGILENYNNVYIQIIGHSCGLCDKALLRTIFQHQNVKKIEACYHSDESKYFEKLYSISRIFDDNTLMRKKLIPLSDTHKI